MTFLLSGDSTTKAVKATAKPDSCASLRNDKQEGNCKSKCCWVEFVLSHPSQKARRMGHPSFSRLVGQVQAQRQLQKQILFGDDKQEGQRAETTLPFLFIYRELSK
jgi:hypothetical protein